MKKIFYFIIDFFEQLLAGHNLKDSYKRSKWINYD